MTLNCSFFQCHQIYRNKYKQVTRSMNESLSLHLFGFLLSRRIGWVLSGLVLAFGLHFFRFLFFLLWFCRFGNRLTHCLFNMVGDFLLLSLDFSDCDHGIFPFVFGSLLFLDALDPGSASFDEVDRVLSFLGTDVSVFCLLK